MYDKIDNRLSERLDRNYDVILQLAKKFDDKKKQDESIQKRLEHHSKEMDDLREKITNNKSGR